jgi:hypothetical protein
MVILQGMQRKAVEEEVEMHEMNDSLMARKGAALAVVVVRR